MSIASTAPRTARALERALSEAGVPARLAGAAPGTPLSALTDDSREAGPGAVFFARAGSHADGAAFARAAVAAPSA